MKTFATLTRVLLLLLITSCRAETLEPEVLAALKDGDVVMIRSYSYNADAIETVTGSRFTHCGIVFKEGDRWIVYEGAGRRGHLNLAEWIKSESAGRAPHWRVFRLRDESKLRDNEVVLKLKASAAILHATPYDHAFCWDFPPGRQERVYCSELVWKAYNQALGVELAPLREIGSYPLNGEALQILNSPICRESRGGRDFDPREVAVAPGDLVSGPLLVEVKLR